MIYAYVDAYSGINEQINLLKHLNLNTIPLRRIGGQSIYTLSKDALDEVNTEFIKQKITVSVIDIEDKYNLEETLDIDKVIAIARLFKVKDVFLNLPSLKNFDEERNALISFLDDVIHRFRKAKINLSFHMIYKDKSAYLAYIIQHNKRIGFTFNPAKVFEHHKSITTMYRMLKENINAVILYDVNKDLYPHLIGYGKTNVTDSLDRLIRDRYKGYIILDTNLLSYVNNRFKLYKRRFNIPLIRNKLELTAYKDIEHKLNLNEHSNITFEDLMLSQVNLLKKYMG